MYGPAPRLANGAAPAAPPDHRIYAIGDIHGRSDLLERLLAKIYADDDTRGDVAHRVLVFLGDYINRGPGVKRIIDILLNTLPAQYETVFLKGNHEIILDEFRASPDGFLRFVNAGGGPTMASYNVPVETLPLGDGYPAACHAAFMECLPAAHQRFFNSLELCREYGDYYFVHAGVKPSLPWADQVEADQCWIRDEFLDHPDPMDKVVVHGHQPMNNIETRAHRISIDTRAWFSGRLTAVRLEGTSIKFLST